MIGRINARFGIGNGKRLRVTHASWWASTAQDPSHAGLGLIRRSTGQRARPAVWTLPSRTRAPFRGALGRPRRRRGGRRPPGSPPPGPPRPRPGGPPRPRRFADSRVPGNDQLAGAQRRLLEIRRIDRKDLPARYLLAECLNGSHVRELAAQTLVALFGSGEPYPVVGGLVALVAQYEDDLVLNVDREAAEHGTGLGRRRGDRVEHELMRDGLAPLDGEAGIVQRQQWRIAMGCGHRT